jgi:hypothetical protein
MDDMGPSSLLREILESTTDGRGDQIKVKVAETSAEWTLLLKITPRTETIGFEDAPALLKLADKYRYKCLVHQIEKCLMKLPLSCVLTTPGYVLHWLELSRQYHLSHLFEACRAFAVLHLGGIQGLSDVECVECSAFKDCQRCSSSISQTSALLLLREATRQLALNQSALASIHRVLTSEGLSVDLVQSKVEIRDWQRWRRLIHTSAQAPSEAAKVKLVARRRTCHEGPACEGVRD